MVILIARLFHFSEDADIARFLPRPVLVPSARGPGREWLNGPLVWAIDEWHQPLYLFPRDCPRILVWPTPQTESHDRATIWGASKSRMIAYIERAWAPALEDAVLSRYELPPESFESLGDAGMWVSRDTVEPVAKTQIEDLPVALQRTGVEVRLLDDLTPLRDLWSTSLHVSGIRLRNAVGWTTQKSD